jgi:hypothetical protein
MTRRPKLRTRTEKENGVTLPRVECRLTHELKQRLKDEAKSLEISEAQIVRDLIVQRLGG